MAGLALYWAEGSKKHAQFTNSDHRAVTFIVGWMRKYLDAEMGTVQLFLHRNQDAEKAIGFWEAKLKRRIAVHVRQKDSRSAAGYGCVQVEFAQQGITAKIIREWIAEVFGEE